MTHKQRRYLKRSAVVPALLLAAAMLLFSACSQHTVNMKEIDKPEREGLETGMSVTGSQGMMNGTDSINGHGTAVLPDEATLAALNNKLIAWGIKRESGGRTPQVSSVGAKYLEKYHGRYLGDPSKPTIYLTFDEGYENGFTASILDTLKAENVKGIFFITGPYLKTEGTLIRRMIDEGHEVGNHTVRHKSMPTLDDRTAAAEIQSLGQDFYAVYKKEMRFFRPPRGEFSERILAITDGLGYHTLMWSFAYQDWNTGKVRGAQYTEALVEKNLHHGAVLLLHAVSEDNARALKGIIRTARQKGYSFGNPDELLKD